MAKKKKEMAHIPKKVMINGVEMERFGDEVVTLQNVAEMDYVANLCGININEPDLNRTAELYYKTLIRAPIADIHDDMMGALQATFDNMILNSYGRALYNRQNIRN